MKHLLSASVLLLLAVAGVGPGRAQPAAKAEPAAKAPAHEAAPLVVWNRPIVTFRAPIGSMTPRERAANAARRIEDVPDELLSGAVQARKSRVGDLEGYLISVEHHLAFGLLAEDLDPLANESLETAANNATERLREVLQARAAQRSLPLLLRGVGLSLAALLGLAVFLRLLVWLRRRLLAQLDPAAGHLTRLQLFEIDFRHHFLAAETRLINLTTWIIGLAAAYLAVTFALSQFPYTQPWGAALGNYLLAIVRDLAHGAVGALPGLGAIAIIFVATRFLVRLLSNLFHQVEAGHIQVSWLLPETARATRRLVVVLTWLFALTVAYPYFPGSNSEAFKGLSVLVGLMISLGSAGVVNQVMSGLVVLYARAVRTGDYVKIGEVEGVVAELGALSTKVVTRRKEEITIPNALLLAAATTNYSRHASAEGALVATPVTIGYDAPWRQVHALLLLAAERTPGVRKEPRAFVQQKALSDFYVEYVLTFAIDRAEDRLPVLSDLHAQIQDAFNEFGVQIMSPHYEIQPPATIVVPPEKWHAAPAQPQ